MLNKTTTNLSHSNGFNEWNAPIMYTSCVGGNVKFALFYFVFSSDLYLLSDKPTHFTGKCLVWCLFNTE